MEEAQEAWNSDLGAEVAGAVVCCAVGGVLACSQPAGEGVEVDGEGYEEFVFGFGGHGWTVRWYGMCGC